MKTKKLISILILTITLALAIYFIITNISSFKQLQITNPELILLRTLLALITLLILGLINKSLLKPLKVNISLKESTQISIVNSFYNLITPFRGGIATRAYYLKKKYNLQYTKFLGLVATSTLLVVLISSIMGLIATLLIYKTENIFNPIIPIIFIITLITTLTIAIIAPTIKETKYKIINNFIRIINSFSQINKNKFFLIAAILTLIQLLIAAYATQLTFGVFGIQISFIKTLFLSSIGGVSLIISLTPANLGISEAITVFSAQTIGISPVHSLSAAILGRLIQFIILFTLGPIASYKLMKNENNTK
jgi:uncharacterized protein (TIRG00374 family)